MDDPLVISVVSLKFGVVKSFVHTHLVLLLAIFDIDNLELKDTSAPMNLL